jgi:hypothetical protein
MGMFDYVHTGTRCGQTKAFSRTLFELTPGTRVDGPDGWYAMREGGWLVVSDGVFVGWVHDAPAVAVARFDNRGRPLGSELPEGYHYTVRTRDEVAARMGRRRDMFGNPDPVAEGEVGEEWMREWSQSCGFPHGCEVCAELRSS